MLSIFKHNNNTFEFLKAIVQLYFITKINVVSDHESGFGKGRNSKKMYNKKLMIETASSNSDNHCCYLLAVRSLRPRLPQKDTHVGTYYNTS